MEKTAILAYKSPMETRKTVNAINYVKDILLENPTFSSVILSSRKTFINDAEKRFSEGVQIEYSSYLTDRTCDSNHIIIQNAFTPNKAVFIEMKHLKAH